MWVMYEGNEPQHVSNFDYDNKPETDGPATHEPPADGDGPGKMGHGDRQPPAAEPAESTPAEQPPAESPAEKPESESPAAPPGEPNP
jgi:hypothetical protein